MAQKPDPGTESINELLIQLINQKVDISVQNQSVSPEGNIVIELNENMYFADNAIITIKEKKLAELDKVVRQLKTVMDISFNKQKKRIKSLSLGDDAKVPVTFEENQISNTEPPHVDRADGRTMLLYDFRQATKYPELADDNFDNGTFNYWFYEKEDFLNVSFSAIEDDDVIKGALEEFKVVMKKRNIEMPIKVSVYEETIRTSPTSSSSRGLIKTFEIKDF